MKTLLVRFLVGLAMAIGALVLQESPAFCDPLAVTFTATPSDGGTLVFGGSITGTVTGSPATDSANGNAPLQYTLSPQLPGDTTPAPGAAYSGAQAFSYTPTAVGPFVITATPVLSGGGGGSMTVSVVPAVTITTQPPARIPIAGGATPITYPVGISITPSGTAVSLSAVCLGGSGAAALSPVTLSASGSATLSGKANSDAANNMTVIATYGGQTLATSTAFTVSTWPVAEALSADTQDDGFGITVNVGFTSESGSQADLGNCYVYEVLTYSTVPNPPFTATEIETQGSDIDMADEGVTDEHDYSPAQVDFSTQQSGSFSGNQAYEWQDGLLLNGWHTLVNNTITREVAPNVLISDYYQFYTEVAGGGYDGSCWEDEPL